jgi:hypothetical protein
MLDAVLVMVPHLRPDTTGPNAPAPALSTFKRAMSGLVSKFGNFDKHNRPNC